MVPDLKPKRLSFESSQNLTHFLFNNTFLCISFILHVVRIVKDFEFGYNHSVGAVMYFLVQC